MAVTGLPLALLQSPGAFDNFWARWFTAADGFVGTRAYTNNTTYLPPPTKNHILLYEVQNKNYA